ncbi:hypothetical protein G3I29_09685 [Streptomyces halstedii]|uniref:Uncharacterized protein n=1 Tax=Streptomyces halstedii TaxID=1944 RepID=A0A6N9TWN8_STRHA|nr:hypothetical protein [Streptomyces halstedii]
MSSSPPAWSASSASALSNASPTARVPPQPLMDVRKLYGTYCRQGTAWSAAPA